MNTPDIGFLLQLEQVIAARPGAIVEFRQWGSFGTREVAVQVVGAVDSVLLQAVTGSGADSDSLARDHGSTPTMPIRCSRCSDARR